MQDDFVINGHVETGIYVLILFSNRYVNSSGVASWTASPFVEGEGGGGWWSVLFKYV